VVTIDHSARVEAWLEANRGADVQFQGIEPAFPDFAGMGRPAVQIVLESLVLKRKHVDTIRAMIDRRPSPMEIVRLADDTIAVYEALARRSLIVDTSSRK
jgi:hypothetical protein